MIAAPDHNVGPVNPRWKGFQLVQIELIVRIGEEHQVHPSPEDPVLSASPNPRSGSGGWPNLRIRSPSLATIPAVASVDRSSTTVTSWSVHSLRATPQARSTVS